MTKISPISFRNNAHNQPPDYKSRLKRMGTGMAIGTTGALIYYKNKNFESKKMWLRSLELGAFCGLTLDLVSMMFEIPKKVKQTRIDANIDTKPFKNKDFFINLYSGKETDSQEFINYQKILSDKVACQTLFRDKDVLKASQLALLEINNNKITEAINNKDLKVQKELEVLNSLLEKSLANNTNNEKQNNISFKAIWNVFHNNNESLKQKAEIAVNRYATSAAATAGILANTGVGDTFALTLITKNMCKKVFKIYGCEGGYVAAITAASVGSVAGTNLLAKGATIWPGAGNALNATITYSIHELEGRALIEFLEENADDLEGFGDAEAVAKFAYKVKSGLNFITNEKVRNILEKAIDKAFDVFF